MSKEFSMFGLAMVMASDEMFVLKRKREKAAECPWMSEDELNEWMMDLYAEIQSDKMYGDSDYY